MSLDAITIVGLFEREDIKFGFDKPPTFLVGPNGTGKSTSLRIIYYLLTAQWRRLAAMPFVALEISIDGITHSLERSDFGLITHLRSQLSRRLRRSAGNFLFPLQLQEVSRLLRPLSPGRMRPVRPIQEETPIPENYLELASVHNFVESQTRGKVLYYPTYRRVERDLSELFDTSTEWEEDVDLTPNIVQRFSSFGEVVGFGGQDIRKLLEDAASKIENEARRALNEHSVRFLEAIARSKAESTAGLRRIVADPEKVANLLRRITSLSPSTIDIAQVERAVNSLREKLARKEMGRLTQREDMLLFYIGELLKLTNRIDALSSDLRRFALLVESYFKPQKSVVLNDFDNTVMISDQNKNEIQLEDLSSGEKQIFAIFAFIMLSESDRGKYIIIDEPELSLSVGWQKALIEDIVKAGRPEILLAATHSPFIIERSNLNGVISLGEI
jgi:predicted ATPase